MSHSIPNHHYNKYKPLRNHVRQLSIELSLQHIWHLSQHLLSDRSLFQDPSFKSFSPKFKTLKNHIYPWELAIILREIILNSESNAKKGLNDIQTLGKVINGIRNYNDYITSSNTSDIDSVLKALHSITQLQFPWQKRSSLDSLIRYLKIFGTDTVNTVIYAQLGLSITELILIGLAARGHLMRYPGFNLKQSYSDFGIHPDKSEIFFERLTINIDSLKEKYKSHEAHTEHWSYTWNQLEQTPFISLYESHHHLIYCPIPELLFKRITSGLFYDIVGASNFDNAYGEAFENYVGEVLNRVFSKPYHIHKPTPIMDGKNIKHRADWLVSAPLASLLIECKTKRLRQNSKVDFDGDPLKEDIHTMAKYIVQTYKNLDVELSQVDTATKQPSLWFPIIVTLEEWFLFSPALQERLEYETRTLLQINNLPESFLLNFPYTIMSISELEVTGQVIDKVGIQQFFEKKCSPNYKNWDLRGFCNQQYKEEMNQITSVLFADEGEKLINHFSSKLHQLD